MTCREYLALYSELLDEQLDVEQEARCRTHAIECSACARYDRVMRRGLQLVREIPGVTATPEFIRRVELGVFRMAEGRDQRRFAAPGTVLALAIASLVAVAAWSPLIQLAEPGDRDSAEMTAGTDSRAGSDARRAQPAVGMAASWYGGTQNDYAHTLTGGMSTPSPFPQLATAFPGPYSPLIVSSPLRGSGASFLIRYGE